MKRILKGALLALLVVAGVSQAKAAKTTFYDNKSWIVGVFGDSDYLNGQELSTKIKQFPMNVPMFKDVTGEQVAQTLTEQGYGKKVLDILTENGQSDGILKHLALANAQLEDKELGNLNDEAQTRSIDDIVSDDYNAILEHLYIAVPYEVQATLKDKQGNDSIATYNFPMLCRVDIDADMAKGIANNLGSNYASIESPKISYVSHGQTYEEIIKDCPDLAVRGVLLQRNPARISIGKNAGINKGDLVTFYSQRINADGEQYSQRISRARVCGVWDNEAQVNFEANTAGNRKNGDIVVKTPDSHMRFGFSLNWTPHTYGVSVLMDDKVGFTRSGIIHHLLVNISGAITDDPGQKFYLEGTNDQYKAPLFINAGVGYGISKTFLGFFDVMPFVIAQADVAYMLHWKGDGAYKSENGDKGLMGFGVRVPVGIRFSFNTGYPIRTFLEAGFSPRFKLNLNKEGEEWKGDCVNQAMKMMNCNRNSIFINFGMMF